MIDHKTDLAVTYIPRNVDAYLAALDPAPRGVVVTKGPASVSPAIDHLLRTALEKKVPSDLRSKLTLAALLRRATDRRLLSSRDVQQIELGPISVDGDRATAQVYYQGTLTALRLPFLKENQAWKIDILGLLPYAEILMRVDRAIKGETEAEQVDQLVSKLPSL